MSTTSGSAVKLARPAKPLPDEARDPHAPRGSTNPSTVSGNWWVKTPTEAGSPYAEEAAGKGFSLLGVPHMGVKRAETKAGQPVVYAKAVPDLLPLNELPKHLIFGPAAEALRDTKRVGDIKLGEWLMRIPDRHPGNYAIHPEHGLVSHDHGEAFTPLNRLWPEAHKTGKILDDEGYSIDRRGPKLNSTDPKESNLGDILNTIGLPHHVVQSLDIHPDTVRRALDNEDEFARLAHDATEDLPTNERIAAVHALRDRFAALRNHVAHHGRVRLGDLDHLHHQVVGGHDS